MRLLFVFVSLFLSFGCFGQSPPQTPAPIPQFSKKIDALFKEFTHSTSPGYAIAITKGHKVVYKKGYGVANLEYSIPITPQSIFSIASVSKQFTGACIALLIMQNKLSLDDKVAQYIPTLKKYKYPLQIKHLLYNTSGLQDYYRLPRKNGKSWITFNYFDVDEAIQTSLQQDTLLFRPGTQWNYCNVNFMLLTKIVEKVSKQTFSEFIQQKLFKPLGMQHSLINDDITNIIKNRVIPYNYRTKESIQSYTNAGIKLNNKGKYIQHWRTSPHYGGSGVMTSIDDLTKWCINFYTKNFGGNQFYKLMHQTIKFEHKRDNQAFGLYTGNFNGRKIVAWDGGDWGISSQIMRFPKKGVAIICLSNLGTGRAYRKVNQIADILIEEGLL